MIFSNLFKPKWRHADRTTRRNAVSRIHDARTLRRIARESDDEWIRLVAARRLDDRDTICTLAKTAAEEAVRFEAALIAKDEICLTTMALNEWIISRGLKAVECISSELLLRRIARSANQDAIRLAAAEKLGHPGLLKAVARSSILADIHWSVAQQLNDPELLAEVAQLKPFSSKLAPMRRKARMALMAYLDQCMQSGDHRALLAVLKKVPHVPIKLEAFVRLPPNAITLEALSIFSTQRFLYADRSLVEKMLSNLRQAGWHVWISNQNRRCIHCQASGQLALKCISTNNTWTNQDRFPCPECRGNGHIAVKTVACRNGDGNVVNLRLPVE